MKLTKQKLKEIIKEEIFLLPESYVNLGQGFTGVPIPQKPQPEELGFSNLLMELQTFLDEWEQKEYPSEKARYMGYYTDIQSLVEKYDSCAHPGKSCDEAHQGEEHEECLERMRSEQQ